jgi:uncharacterized glyoxalase superfamily protein PhnB
MSETSTKTAPDGAPRAAQTGPVIVPWMRYDDAPRVIEWLVRAFGFQKQAVYPNEDGTIAHAQLTFGPGVIMLATSRKDFINGVSPKEVGGVTGGVYIVLDKDEDVDVHCERARAAGAEILQEPENPDYGGRGYTARDFEGHVWSFGTYGPES